MNGEERIQFAEASQAFLCDEYYKNIHGVSSCELDHC